MAIIDKYKFWIFYIVVFTLPMYTKLNNIFLAIFICIGILEILLSRKKLDVRHFLFTSLPVLVFFGLSLLASFRSFDIQALKYLENHWSLLFIPFVMLTNASEYHSRRREIFLALLTGTALTLLICNVNHALEMLSNGIAVDKWFNGEFFGQEFTNIADTQPAYLSLFVVTSILFLIQDNVFIKWLKYVLLGILLIGLLQLTSKIALLLLLLFLLYMISYYLRKRKQQSIVLITGLLICAFVFIVFGAKYMKGQLFFVDSFLDEKRIERWEVSYEIFKENPLIGVGYGNIDVVRMEKYLEGNYSLAAENELNAHNQFLEYLSIDGAIGGFVYAIALAFLFFLSIERKDHLFTFVIFAFILANLTESMMVRIKGIEYFSIFATLFLCSIKQSSTDMDDKRQVTNGE